MRASAHNPAGSDEVEDEKICCPSPSIVSFPGRYEESLCTEGSFLSGFVSRGGKRFYSIKALIHAEMVHLKHFREAVSKKLASYNARVEALRTKKLRRYLLHGGVEEDFWFFPKPFRPPVYKPRFYDFGSCRALHPVVPPIAGQPRAKHACQHVRWSTPVGATRLRCKMDSISDWQAWFSRRSLQVTGPSTAAPLVDLNGNPLSIPNGAQLGGPIDVSMRSILSVPDYDERKCASAVRSCLLQSRVVVDIPQFVIELRDIKKTITSFVRLAQETGANVCRGLDWVCREFRHPTRFGMTTNSIWQRALVRMGKSSSDVLRNHNTNRFADRMVRRLTGAKSDGVPLYELVDMVDALTGADLAYKFGYAPAVRDLLNTARIVLGKLDGFWRRVEALIKWNGKPLRFNRVVSDRASIQQRVVDPLQQATAMLQGFDFGNGGVRPTNWGTAVSDAWQRCRLPRERSCVITDRVKWTATPVVTFFLRSLAGLPLTDDEIVEGAVLDAFGLNVFRPSLLWDLLPFSFVVDWFVDIGALIERFDVMRIRPEPLWDVCVITRRHQHVERLQAIEATGTYNQDSGLPPTKYDYSVSFKDPAQTVWYKRFERWLIDPENMLPLEFEELKHPIVEWWHKITGAELVYQLFTRM